MVTRKNSVGFGLPGLAFLWKATLAALCCVALTVQASAAVPVPQVKPPAPGPVYLSPADYNVLEQFFEALDDRKWSLAERHRADLSDPVARSIASWAWFRKDPPDLDYLAAGDFLGLHETWPSRDYIQELAEKSIDEDQRPEDVLAFFDTREPLTGVGKLRLAQALLAGNERDRAADYFRAAWIDHDWSSSNERDIIRNYRQFLRPEDHVAKADRQLFEIQATNTQRILGYLPASDKRMAQARIALLRRDGNAMTLFNRLSQAEKADSGVLHAITRYYRRGDEELSALSYAREAPFNETDLRNTEAWWTEKRLLARWALKNGFYEDAYAMTAFTGLIEGEAFAQAEFEAGWIALRFLDEPERARPHFAYLNAGVTAPISRARAQYWLGRTFAELGDPDRAAMHYMVAAEYPHTYYGQLAYENVADRLAAPRFPEVTVPTEDDRVVFNARQLVYMMRVLAELDRDYDFIIAARELDDQLRTAGEYAAYEEFMFEEGKLFLSVRAGKVSVNQNIPALSVSYPLIAVPDEAKAFAEQALILGLSRQESEFNPRAFSSAQARGIMQLLASTAQITARKEGLPYYRSRLLDDPSYNMIIGSAHLKHLLERFDGSYILTLAGYNAGPHRSDTWMDSYGDPRDPNVDPVDWVELIPFSETRNYVQRVMENIQVYRARIDNEPIPGQLSRDLVRGGGTVTAIGIRPPTPAIGIASNRTASMTSTIPDVIPAAFTATADMTVGDMLGFGDQGAAPAPMDAGELMFEQLEAGPGAALYEGTDRATNDADDSGECVSLDGPITTEDLNAQQLSGAC